MNVDHLMGLNVIGSEDGTSIGSVKGLLISQSEKRLIALEIGGGMLSHPLFLPFESIKSIENEVLMVPSAKSLIDKQNLPDVGITESLAGRRVFTEDGKDLGSVRGYSVDPQTGQISTMTFAVDKNVLGGLWKSAGDSYEIPGESIRTLGENVVVDSSVPNTTGMDRAA